MDRGRHRLPARRACGTVASTLPRARRPTRPTSSKRTAPGTATSPSSTGTGSRTPRCSGFCCRPGAPVQTSSGSRPPGLPGRTTRGGPPGRPRRSLFPQTHAGGRDEGPLAQGSGPRSGQRPTLFRLRGRLVFVFRPRSESRSRSSRRDPGLADLRAFHRPGRSASDPDRAPGRPRRSRRPRGLRRFRYYWHPIRTELPEGSGTAPRPSSDRVPSWSTLAAGLLRVELDPRPRRARATRRGGPRATDRPGPRRRRMDRARHAPIEAVISSIEHSRRSRARGPRGDSAQAPDEKRLRDLRYGRRGGRWASSATGKTDGDPRHLRPAPERPRSTGGPDRGRPLGPSTPEVERPGPGRLKPSSTPARPHPDRRRGPLPRPGTRPQHSTPRPFFGDAFMLAGAGPSPLASLRQATGRAGAYQDRQPRASPPGLRGSDPPRSR